jgi:ribosomal protein S18 acetylase RimI-like enzyme
VIFDENAFAHYGVKGMKWGVRKQDDAKPKLTGYIKEPIKMTTPNGDEFTLTPVKPNKIIKTLGKISTKYVKNYNKAAALDIRDKDGKQIGNAGFWLKGKDDIYLNWITIEKSARGRGYATEVMKAAAVHGKKTGRKRLVLEVPGNAPDARHIYTKMGFKPTGKKTGVKGDIWDGLEEMEYTF